MNYLGRVEREGASGVVGARSMQSLRAWCVQGTAGVCYEQAGRHMQGQQAKT